MKTHETYRIRWKRKGRKDCVHTRLLDLIVQGLTYQFYIESKQSGNLSTTVGSFASRQCSHIQLLKQRRFIIFIIIVLLLFYEQVILSTVAVTSPFEEVQLQDVMPFIPFPCDPSW